MSLALNYGRLLSVAAKALRNSRVMTFTTKAAQANPKIQAVKAKPAAGTLQVKLVAAKQPKVVKAAKVIPKAKVGKKLVASKAKPKMLGLKKAAKKATKKVVVAKPGVSKPNMVKAAAKATPKAKVGKKLVASKAKSLKGLKNVAKKATKKVAVAKPGVSKPSLVAAKAAAKVTPKAKVGKKLVASKAKPKSLKGLKKAAKKATKKVAVAKEQRFSAYQLFVKDNFATATGAAFSDKTKALAAAWKALPAEQKQKYLQRSQSEQGLKKKNLSGMSLFIKQNYSRVQSLPKLVEEWKQLGKEEKEQYIQRAAKGEGSTVLKRQSAKSRANKKVSAYTAFFKKVYPTLPGSTLAERAKAAASQWKALSEQEKQAYNTQKAKTRSGYGLYLQEQMKQNKLAMAIVASQWKAMTDAERETYKVKAKSL